MSRKKEIRQIIFVVVMGVSVEIMALESLMENQFRSGSSDGGETERAGERKKPTEAKKPSWLSRLFGGRSRGNESSMPKGRDEGVISGRNPGDTGQRAPIVDEPAQVGQENRTLNQEEKEAIAKAANERGFRSLFKKKPKFDTAPQNLTDEQLNLYAKLIAKFEKDPNGPQTGYLNVHADLNFNITEADRSLIIQIANSARDIALFKRRVTKGFSEAEKTVLNTYLGRNKNGYLKIGSVAQYEHRIAVAVKVLREIKKILAENRNATKEQLLKRFNGNSGEEKSLKSVATELLTDDALSKLNVVEITY